MHQRDASSKTKVIIPEDVSQISCFHCGASKVLDISFPYYKGMLESMLIAVFIYYGVQTDLGAETQNIFSGCLPYSQLEISLNHLNDTSLNRLHFVFLAFTNSYHKTIHGNGGPYLAVLWNISVWK